MSAYDGIRAFVAAADEPRSWLPTDCEGWSVRDLVLHCLMDAQRGLVALHTPTDELPDRDAVTYWQDWAPDPVGSANGRRFTRVMASMFLHFHDLRELFLETSAAVLHAANEISRQQPIRTQGHVLAAGDLMSTLAVEATLHHLDMLASVPDAPEPAADCLAHVRQVLDGLLGESIQVPWTDVRYARVATGRRPLTDAERKTLGATAARIPVFS